MKLDTLFEQFLQEKTYIQNCAPLTIKHFRSSYKTYRKFVQDDEVTQDSINRFVVEARKADMSVGCLNSYIRGFNSFLDWLFAAELTPTHLRIRLLKQEKKIGRSFTDDELRRMTSFKPKTFSQKRIHVLTLALLDTGCRINELLTLRRECVDFDNLLIKVMGKGSKERIIPMSLELRKVLFRYMRHGHDLVFPDKFGNKWNHQNCHRDFTKWLVSINISPIGFHALRRTYAKNYLKYGGNLFYLKTVLGHSRLETTQCYVEVETDALKETHQKTSLLTRFRQGA
jgi:integrase/recombinase XerD